MLQWSRSRQGKQGLATSQLTFSRLDPRGKCECRAHPSLNVHGRRHSHTWPEFHSPALPARRLPARSLHFWRLCGVLGPVRSCRLRLPGFPFLSFGEPPGAGRGPAASRSSARRRYPLSGSTVRSTLWDGSHALGLDMRCPWAACTTLPRLGRYAAKRLFHLSSATTRLEPGKATLRRGSTN